MENTYPYGENHVCADCGHEWPIAAAPDAEDTDAVAKDANGNALADGDHEVDCKMDGGSFMLKACFFRTV